ncbi:MAG: HAMP domain-containing histidine kinase [Acidobacteriales bacterium]|nr:HAMP domain-containing histidine kinase [Terriglobales bacterium]
MPDSTSTAATPATAGEVVRHIAHDLRQPLSTIESIAYYLDITLPDTEARARAQAGRLQQMVEQCNCILTDAIHYLQAAPPRMELLDLSELISETLAEWPGEGMSQIRYEPEEQVAAVLVDASQAQHLLCNLFRFFQQAAHGGDVFVRTWAQGEQTCLEFSGPAPDYDAESLATLFEPFNTHLQGGSGLALASVRHIVEAHGATLNASFDARGHLHVRIMFR